MAFAVLYVICILLNAWSLRVWQKQWAHDKAFRVALAVKIAEVREQVERELGPEFGARAEADLARVMPRSRTAWFVLWYAVCIGGMLFNASLLMTLPFRVP